MDQSQVMRDRAPQLLDMTADGGFVASPPRGNWPLRLGVGAAIVGIAAAALAVAALFLWIASVLIPVALVAGVIAYAAFRFQQWRMRRAPVTQTGRRRFN